MFTIDQTFFLIKASACNHESHSNGKRQVISIKDKREHIFLPEIVVMTSVSTNRVNLLNLQRNLFIFHVNLIFFDTTQKN
jgi:hypothetical protein